MTIGPDGKSHVKEFGILKAVGNKRKYLDIGKPQITAERKPLLDITTTYKK